MLGTLLGLGCREASTGPPALHRIAVVTPAALSTFMVNDTARMQVVGYDQAGNSYPAGPVTWRSTNPAVVPIDTSGRVVGLTVGSATIVASVGPFIDSVSVNVVGTRHRWPITVSETWTMGGSPHLVHGRLSVGGPVGATLTIEPGVTVTFADTAGLTFGLAGPGSLLAQGSAAAPITLRGTSASPAPAAWIGLTFRGHNRSELHHVTMSGCGRTRSDDQPIGCLVLGHRFLGPDPTLLVDDVAVQDAAGGAVILQDKSRFASGSAGLSVRNMRGHIATLPAGAAAAFPLGGTFVANDTNEVRLSRDTLRESAAWASTIPWVVLDPVLIEGPLQPVLTIPAGVTVPFGYGGGFVVGKNAPGGLHVGTEGGAMVNLRGMHGNGWAGVDFFPASLPSSISNAVLENCGGYTDTGYGQGCVFFIGNFYGTAPAPVLKNVTIRGATDVGVSAVGGGRFGTGSNNLTITGTTGSIGSPLWFYMSSPSTLPSGNYTGNGEDAIRVYAVEIAVNETWHDPGVPYVLSGGLAIGHAANPTLTLDPGVVIRFAPGGLLSIGQLAPGGLHAVGTETAPIVLTSQYDFPGAWMGITIGPYADPTMVFDHVVVDYGGADDGHLATAFRIARDYGPFIRNTLTRRSAGCGITRMSGTAWSTDFTMPALGNTFQDNLGPAQCGP